VAGYLNVCMSKGKPDMKKDFSGRASTVIRAWADEDDKKITIQIEDREGETLASIQLSADKASDLADNLAIYSAKLKLAARDKAAAKNTAMGRPALLC
jgi:hypothetical protein